ncbi:MAG TPA: hypothetical protein VHY21_09855 [Pseudonocardiaceae bacterium]|nr:hypothetical protein [Pseudonocardiaceae bacterium]
MSGPGLPEVRRADRSLPRRVSRSLRWVLSPLDYRAHVLVDGGQPVGVVAARCGAVLPVVFPVHDQPSGRPCPPCEVTLRVHADAPGGFARKPPR